MRIFLAAVLVFFISFPAYCEPPREAPAIFAERRDIRDKRDPVEFKLPAGWRNAGSDNPKYDFLFVSGKNNDPGSFGIYLRSLNVSDQDALKWAADEREAHRGRKAQFVSELRKENSGKREWVKLESIWLARNNQEHKPAALWCQQYFSKEAGSNTIVEVAVMGRQDKITDKLMAQVGEFVGSIRCGKDTRKNPSKK